MSAIVARSFGIYRGNSGFDDWKAVQSKPCEILKTLGGTCYLRVRLKSITASNITRDSRARVNPLVSVKVANIAHACLGMTLRT